MHGGEIEGQLWNSGLLLSVRLLQCVCVWMQHSQPLMRTEPKQNNKKWGLSLRNINKSARTSLSRCLHWTKKLLKGWYAKKKKEFSIPLVMSYSTSHCDNCLFLLPPPQQNEGDWNFAFDVQDIGKKKEGNQQIIHKTYQHCSWDWVSLVGRVDQRFYLDVIILYCKHTHTKTPLINSLVLGCRSTSHLMGHLLLTFLLFLFYM